jgi:hypothetical protein
VIWLDPASAFSTYEKDHTSDSPNCCVSKIKFLVNENRIAKGNCGVKVG